MPPSPQSRRLHPGATYPARPEPRDAQTAHSPGAPSPSPAARGAGERALCPSPARTPLSHMQGTNEQQEGVAEPPAGRRPASPLHAQHSLTRSRHTCAGIRGRPVAIIQRITWVSPPTITLEWKRKVAQEAIESLSASKLAKSICSQFRTRLNSSHEAFAASLRQLEAGHSGRLEKTEDLWLKVRKDHAPRLARLSLESRSLQDVLLHRKPKLGQELGRGQYGVVYLCDNWGGHFPCALKSVVPPDEKHWNDLALEFHYMRSLPKHERLVDLHGSVIDYNYGGGSSIAVLLIMERLHRDLYTGLKAGLTLETRLQIALDVVEGIRFLHSQGLVHRDIKLKNVLLDKQNRAKITDLGFCKPEAMMSGSIVGTPIHMAPELFTGKYDNSVDVYAFGILFWYICSGSVKLPEAFERCASKDHLWNNVRRGTRPERLPVFDEECWQLMEACWDGDPSKRPLLGIVQPMLRSIMDRLCKSNSEQPNRGLDDST
uniref:Dual serine/threonine and tyrosine protein kinase n=1 Tax=Castor canadensis TaxID=51338 RepID=A0A8B7USX5_CASCN|nr:dual serine/threonine and tyrosine protein kinase-like [Castor canadensis]